MIELPVSATDLARALAVVTPAGPDCAPVVAAAIVTRLRKSTAWADSHLLSLSEAAGLADAARRVVGAPTVIVDRRGAIRAAGRVFDRVLDARTPGALSRQATAMRVVGAAATGLWNPVTHRRILIAPNVLVAARRHALDQADWCKWVALRTGLRGVVLERAPFLVEHLRRLVVAEDGDGVLRLVLLLEALPLAQMETLTPGDLSSVGWIRSHRGATAAAPVVRALLPVGPSQSAIERTRNAAEGFAREVLREGMLADLLTAPDRLPSADEFAAPELWVARVR